MKKSTIQSIIYTMTLIFVFNCTNNFVFGQTDTINEIQKIHIPPPPPPPPPPPSCSDMFSYVDEMPIWGTCLDKPKGEQRECSNEAVVKFVQDHLEYPKEALLHKITGTAVVTFTVEKDGSMKDIRLVRKIGYGTDEEALRIVNLMASEGPKWKAGQQRGRTVRVQFNLPVQFKLQ